MGKQICCNNLVPFQIMESQYWDRPNSFATSASLAEYPKRIQQQLRGLLQITCNKSPQDLRLHLFPLAGCIILFSLVNTQLKQTIQNRGICGSLCNILNQVDHLPQLVGILLDSRLQLGIKTAAPMDSLNWSWPTILGVDCGELYCLRIRIAIGHMYLDYVST